MLSGWMSMIVTTYFGLEEILVCMFLSACWKEQRARSLSFSLAHPMKSFGLFLAENRLVISGRKEDNV